MTAFESRGKIGSPVNISNNTQPSLGWASLIPKAPQKGAGLEGSSVGFILCGSSICGHRVGQPDRLARIWSLCLYLVSLGLSDPPKSPSAAWNQTKLTRSNLLKTNTWLRKIIKIQKPKATQTSGRARKPFLSIYYLSIITEGDPKKWMLLKELIGGKKWSRVVVVSCLLSISYVPNTAPHAFNVSTSFSPYIPLLPPLLR